jgi:hypothetical protein
MAKKKKKSAVQKAYDAGYRRGLKVGRLTPKSKKGSAGPSTHWLNMSVAQRAKTKQYIKEGLNGHIRQDGVSIPGARRIFSGLDAKHGFDLRHVERWSAAKLNTARTRIQTLNTLTSRPFSVIVPRTKKQREAAKKFTGQDAPRQKEYITQVQIQGRDKARFLDGKVAIERKFPSGSKTIKQRFLFKDYLQPGESLKDLLNSNEGLSEADIEEDLAEETLQAPSTFRQMVEVTLRMLKDMPVKVYGEPAFYAIVSPQYGPIGRTATHGRVISLLQEYMNTYDPGGEEYRGHQQFAEVIVGFQMIGTKVQLTEYEILQRERAERAKERKRLRFSKQKRVPLRCPHINKKGQRCVLNSSHKGKHRYTGKRQ